MDADVELLYIGTERGLENTLVPKEGIPFQAIEIEGFKRRFDYESLKYNLKSIYLFIKSIKTAKDIIRDFKPDVVLGTGGYVSAPICYAAAKADIATIVHEQNSYLGLTNKFLIRYIDKLVISFDDIYEQTESYAEKIVFTGNPRGQEVAAAPMPMLDSLYGLDVTQPTVLIFGGSRGANRMNEAVVDAYPQLLTKNYQTLFVTGKNHYEKIQKQLNDKSPLSLQSQMAVKPYIHQMMDVLHYTEAIVSRSGATTIAEITALGMPSILIPSPNVTADHQTKNAMSLVRNNAAELLPEEELSGEKLLQMLDQLMNNPRERALMGDRAREIGEPYATDQLIQVMLDEMKQKNS